MTKTYDFVIVGGGIGGVAVAHELAAYGSACLIEREEHLAYHTTGRSAAISMESYGNATIRALTAISTQFLKEPPQSFSEAELWRPRGAMILADEGMVARLDARIEAVSRLVPTIRRLSPGEILAFAPFLRKERWVSALYEPNAFDLDVHGIHSAFLRGFRSKRGEVRTNAGLTEVKRQGGTWLMTLANGERLETANIVNAAGAWADKVAENCGVPGVSLQPLRRTVLHVDPKIGIMATPYIGTVDERIFIKPESGGLLISPCDETPCEPCDAWPEDIDAAIAMERFEQTTTLMVKNIGSKWAGLRCFVADRSPVVGPDDAMDGFHWLAALGGYGIQTAPAMASLCCALIVGSGIPKSLAHLGITADAVAPARCRSKEFADRQIEHVAELA